MDLKDAMKERRQKLGVKISIGPQDALEHDNNNEAELDEHPSLTDAHDDYMMDESEHARGVDNKTLGLAPDHEEQGEGLDAKIPGEEDETVKDELEDISNALLKHGDEEKMKGMMAKGVSPRGLNAKAKMEIVKSKLK